MTRAEVLTPEQRRRRIRREMINDILSIAREMMRTGGVMALTFNGIARRLGMTPPALYTYFDSKHAIYDALFRQGHEELGRRVRHGVPDRGSPYERVKALFEAYLSFAQENPDLYELMTHRPVPGFLFSEESASVSLTIQQESEDWLRQILGEAKLAPGMSCEEARDLLLALMQGLANLHLAHDPELAVGNGRFGGLTPRAVQLFIEL